MITVAFIAFMLPSVCRGPGGHPAGAGRHAQVAEMRAALGLEALVVQFWRFPGECRAGRVPASARQGAMSRLIADSLATLELSLVAASSRWWWRAHGRTRMPGAACS